MLAAQLVGQSAWSTTWTDWPKGRDIEWGEASRHGKHVDALNESPLVLSGPNPSSAAAALYMLYAWLLHPETRL